MKSPFARLWTLQTAFTKKAAETNISGLKPKTLQAIETLKKISTSLLDQFQNWRTESNCRKDFEEHISLQQEKIEIWGEVPKCFHEAVNDIRTQFESALQETQ